MEYKKFHIITPCYNHQIYLDRCIKSVEDQDYPKNLITMTVIDDNSEVPLKTEETSFYLKKLVNQKRMFPAFNRYQVYSNCDDNVIIIFLDGDDWLNDSRCLSLINKIYNQNEICWTISNHKTFKNNRTKILPTFVTLPLEIDKPKICHLRSGYGYVWNKMDLDWLKFEEENIRWMSDWNENLFALKNFGQPYKIESSISTYNLDTSKTRNENNNFKDMINFFKNKFNLIEI